MMGLKEFFQNWGKLAAIVIAFLAFPALILGVLAAFRIEIKLALIWTGQIVGVIYGFTGLIAGYHHSVKWLARKECLKILKENKLIKK